MMNSFWKILKIIICFNFLSTSFLAFAGIGSHVRAVILDEKPHDLQGDCGKPYVEVFYNDPLDYEIACEGIQKAESFLETYLNYKAEKPIKILFGNAMVIEYKSNGQVDRTSVVGAYDLKDKHIVIQPWEMQKHQKQFGEFPAGKGFLVSNVVHELIHFIHYLHLQNLLFIDDKDLKVKSGKEAYISSEILSSLAQIETMDLKEKEQVLSLSETAYFDEFEMSELNYWLNHYIFAVKSYRFWRDNPDFIDRIFNGQWKSAPMTGFYIDID